MYASYSTHLLPQSERQHYWKEVIGQSYFPLELSFRDPKQFYGSLTRMSLGDIGISYLASSATCFERVEQDIDASEPYYLITLPLKSHAAFAQSNHEISCSPNAFILERSDLPYRFSYEQDNSLWVLRVPVDALAAKVRDPERFLYMEFDRRQGVGAVFFDYLRSVVKQSIYTSAQHQAVLSNQLIELLAFTLNSDDRVITSNEEGIRRAHLQNIESFVRENLSRIDLSPEVIANACNISTRYLHKLFKDSDQTVSQWVKELRLQGALNDIKTYKALPLADVAYKWGFTDQAHFCRLFKGRFKCTPREMRNGG